MKIIDKIDNLLDNLEAKLEDLIKLHEGKVGGKEYDDFFKSMLAKYKVKSYKDLPANKQKEFFNAVDKEWKSKVEKGKTSKKYKKGEDSWGDD
jgi:hypothetical protein